MPKIKNTCKMRLFLADRRLKMIAPHFLPPVISNTSHPESLFL